MVHPKPAGPAREALYGYMIGRRTTRSAAEAGEQFEPFKARRGAERAGCAVPDADGAAALARRMGEIARNAPWQMTRMNLNTFARHGVFEEPGMTRADRGAAARCGGDRGERACSRTS